MWQVRLRTAIFVYFTLLYCCTCIARGLSVCLSVNHKHTSATKTAEAIEMPFEVWTRGHQRHRVHVLLRGPGILSGKRRFGVDGVNWAPFRLYRARCSQPYAQGDSSDVASGYQYCSNLFIIRHNVPNDDPRSWRNNKMSVEKLGLLSS